MLSINYGQNQRHAYFNAIITLKGDFERGKLCALTHKINTTFFDGGPFAAKSWSKILTIKIPATPHKSIAENDALLGPKAPQTIQIATRVSISALLGYVEGVPIIGSAIAIIHAIGESFNMIKSYAALKKTIQQMHLWEQNPDDRDIRGMALPRFANEIFNASVAYTNAQNALLGALVSIIPLLKPIIRLAQVAIHNSAKPSNDTLKAAGTQVWTQALQSGVEQYSAQSNQPIA